MIVSFLIFVGFVFVFFIFFTPTKQNTISSAALDLTQKIIIENSSFNYDYASLIISSDYDFRGVSCISIENSLGISGNAVARDVNNNLLKTKQVGNIISIELPTDKRYYRLYFSDYFAPLNLGSTDCTQLTPGSDYNYSVVSTSTGIMYDNLQVLNDAYMANYEKLKNDFGLRNNFEFAVYNLSYSVIMNDTLSMHKAKPVQVLSRNIPLKAIYRNGSDVDLILNLRVWA